MVINFFANFFFDFYFLPLVKQFKVGTSLQLKNIKMVPPLIQITYIYHVHLKIHFGISIRPEDFKTIHFLFVFFSFSQFFACQFIRYLVSVFQYASFDTSHDSIFKIFFKKLYYRGSLTKIVNIYRVPETHGHV